MDKEAQGKIRGWIPRNIGVLPSDENYECCYGYPDMMEYPDGCPMCGCREAGNASYTCPKHYSVINSPSSKGSRY